MVVLLQLVLVSLLSLVTDLITQNQDSGEKKEVPVPVLLLPLRVASVLIN